MKYHSMPSRILLFGMLFLCSFTVLTAQDDEPYYNSRDNYPQHVDNESVVRISANLARPFYRDLAINAEIGFAEDFSFSLGFGLYLPKTYSFKFDSFDDNVPVSINTSGFRIVYRVNSYTEESLIGGYGSFEASYNSLPGLKFEELGMCIGYVIKVYKSINICPELGFGGRKYHKNNAFFQSDHNFPVPFIIANASLGFNF